MANQTVLGSMMRPSRAKVKASARNLDLRQAADPTKVEREIAKAKTKVRKARKADRDPAPLLVPLVLPSLRPIVVLREKVGRDEAKATLRVAVPRRLGERMPPLAGFI